MRMLLGRGDACFGMGSTDPLQFRSDKLRVGADFLGLFWDENGK